MDSQKSQQKYFERNSIHYFVHLSWNNEIFLIYRLCITTISNAPFFIMKGSSTMMLQYFISLPLDFQSLLQIIQEVVSDKEPVKVQVHCDASRLTTLHFMSERMVP